MLSDETIRELILAWYFKILCLCGSDFFGSESLENWKIKNQNTDREDEKSIRVLNKNEEESKNSTF